MVRIRDPQGYNSTSCAVTAITPVIVDTSLVKTTVSISSWCKRKVSGHIDVCSISSELI